MLHLMKTKQDCKPYSAGTRPSDSNARPSASLHPPSLTNLMSRASARRLTRLPVQPNPAAHDPMRALPARLGECGDQPLRWTPKLRRGMPKQRPRSNGTRNRVRKEAQDEGRAAVSILVTGCDGQGHQ